MKTVIPNAWPSPKVVGAAISLVTVISTSNSSVWAQTPSETNLSPDNLLLTQAAQDIDLAESAPLKVKPRVGLNFQSGPGVGYDASFGGLNFFVPFGQTPEQSTFYTAGQVNLFTNDDNFNSNLRLGYRTRLNQMVLGCYVGWDVTQTGSDESFHQIGLGADLQGDKWIISTNAYLPVGSTRRQVGSQTVDNGTTLSDFRFSGNNLLYASLNQQTTFQVYEAAMTGIDVEAGYELLSWEHGGLYGYGGIYLLDAEGTSSVVGGRGRLQATVDNVQGGLAIQSDDNFGTTVTVNLGLTFGGNATRKTDETLADSLVARLGNEVQRQQVIAIDQQTVTTFSSTQTDNLVARNPATGQDWRFLHVTDGITGGDGTFENPVGAVTDATAMAATAGNDVIYVNAGDRSGLAGFTIPDNVQVLSTGVSQSLDVQAVGNTPLPGAGSGTVPLVNSTITMGNGSTLSGFDVQTVESNSIVARNVSDFTIDRNQVTTNAGNGIQTTALTGETLSNATISGNSIVVNGNVGNAGIIASAYDGGTINNSIVTGNSITINGRGTGGIVSLAIGGNISNTTVTNNTIATNGDITAGVVSFAANNGTVTNSTVTDNLIDISGNNSNGTITAANGNGTLSNVTISGNTITTRDVGSQGNNILSGFGSTVGGVTLSNNTITTNGDLSDGISISSQTGTLRDTTVSGNTLTTLGDEANGVGLSADSGVLDNTTISGNTISTSGNYANGIYGEAYAGVVNNTTISGNTIETTGNYSDGIYAYAYDGALNNVTISGNTLSTVGTDSQGIYASLDKAGTLDNVTITNNQIPQAGQHSVLLQTNAATSNICIAQFSDNASNGPNAAGGGGNDLNISVAVGSTVDFVEFNNVTTNNTGFDDVLGTPSGQPSTCP